MKHKKSNLSIVLGSCCLMHSRAKILGHIFGVSKLRLANDDNKVGLKASFEVAISFT